LPVTPVVPKGEATALIHGHNEGEAKDQCAPRTRWEENANATRTTPCVTRGSPLRHRQSAMGLEITPHQDITARGALKQPMDRSGACAARNPSPT